MNNKDKEKAKEIAWVYSKHYDPNACKQEWVEMGAREMAIWKDEQLKQFLKDRYNKNLGSIKSWEAESIYQELFNEPISEQPMNF